MDCGLRGQWKKRSWVRETGLGGGQGCRVDWRCLMGERSERAVLCLGFISSQAKCPSDAATPQKPTIQLLAASVVTTPWRSGVILKPSGHPPIFSFFVPARYEYATRRRSAHLFPTASQTPLLFRHRSGPRPPSARPRAPANDAGSVWEVPDRPRGPLHRQDMCGGAALQN